jgi:hypothetical protein
VDCGFSRGRPAPLDGLCDCRSKAVPVFDNLSAALACGLSVYTRLVTRIRPGGEPFLFGFSPRPDGAQTQPTQRRDLLVSSQCNRPFYTLAKKRTGQRKDDLRALTRGHERCRECGWLVQMPCLRCKMLRDERIKKLDEAIAKDSGLS